MFFVFIVVIYAALTFGFSYNKREWLYVFVYFILYYMANQFLSLINFGINLLINPNLLDVENTEGIYCIKWYIDYSKVYFVHWIRCLKLFLYADTS